MGALAYHADRRDEALKWYGEAVKLNSDNYFAYFNFANLTLATKQRSDDPEIEKSLRMAVKLNPRFYPASEFLVTVLTSLDRDADAIAVLEDAQKMAATPLDAAKAKVRIAQLQQAQTARKSAATASAQTTALPAGATPVALDVGPKHPTEPADGPKHEAFGSVRDVKCSYPSVIEFRVEGTIKTVSLYSNNYYKIEFTALGFTPEGAIQPCSDIEGMKARVQYAESSDKTVDGQVIAVELRK
jgi:tetratricopeptide (TPR) repeat protein